VDTARGGGRHVEPDKGAPISALTRANIACDQRDTPAPAIEQGAWTQILAGIPAPLFEAIPALVAQRTFSLDDVPGVRAAAACAQPAVSRRGVPDRRSSAAERGQGERPREVSPADVF